jgi:hypothetical protein
VVEVLKMIRRLGYGTAGRGKDGLRTNRLERARREYIRVGWEKSGGELEMEWRLMYADMSYYEISAPL